MNLGTVKSRITKLLRKYLPSSQQQANTLVPDSLKSGKLYEVYVLGLIAKELTEKEGYQLKLINSNKVRLKASPGPINSSFPHIEVWKNGQHKGDIWTDVEFVALSHSLSGVSTDPNRGQYHELDIVLVPPGTIDRPAAKDIYLAVECKNTGYQKNLLREILGVRRELSLYRSQPEKHILFSNWPSPTVPAHPASCLLVYSTDSKVHDFEAPGSIFGIKFYYEPLP